MVVNVAYFKHMRKDGSYNLVCFDTDRKIFSNDHTKHSFKSVLVEAAMSKDIDFLREELIRDGYAESEEVWK